MISVENAVNLIMENIGILGIERVDILNALGRIIGEDIFSSRDIPPWDNSAMDGYAVRYNDVTKSSRENPSLLEVIEDLPAGYSSRKIVEEGKAVRIMTGAPLPKGADTVIMVEDTEKKGNKVKIFTSPEPGQNIRKAGEDVKKGELVIKKGSLVRAPEIGMLASLKRTFVSVYQKPRVAILATGDELIDVDDETGEAKIVNSNSYTLASQIKDCGALPLIMRIARDTRKDLETKLKESLIADVIITSGGVSVGEYDFVKEVLQNLGAEMKFWKVAMRPGQPLAFGLLEKKPVFGLPGNPVSSMISFEQFVRPSLLKMMGHKKLFRPVITAILGEELKKKPGRRHFLRGVVRVKDEKYYVSSTGDQGSGILKSMVTANGLIVLHDNKNIYSSGEKVKVQLLDKNFEMQEKWPL